jgi:hypothetical protein
MNSMLTSLDAAVKPYRRLLTTLMLVLAVAFPGLLSAQTTNGQARRPFWIFAHNPNEMSNVDDTVANGGNALEPDIMFFPNSVFCSLFLGKISPSNLYIYHDAGCEIVTRKPDTVEDYLDHVHDVVAGGGNIALIAFDIKSEAAEQPNLVKKLHDAVSAHLNNGKDGVLVNILYSVGSIADEQDGGGVFAQIIPLLGDNEGVQIDGENDPANVYNTLSSGGTQHIGFGNGSFGVSIGYAPNVLPSIMEASWIRAGQISSGFVVSYGFPIPIDYPPAYDIAELELLVAGFPLVPCTNPAIQPCLETSLWYDLINAGVDGLIADFDEQPQIWSDTKTQMKSLYSEIVNAAPGSILADLYIATAADNPFHRSTQAYGLRIDTHVRELSELDPGTTDNLTFTLIGQCGQSQVTINSNYPKLFGHGDRNYVTIPSKNLGLLNTLKLSSDGNDTWKPTNIQISSALYGIPYSDNRIVSFEGLGVDKSHPQSKPLGNWGYGFSAFSAKLNIYVTPQQKGFALLSNLTLASASQVINPVAEQITLKIGTFTIAIPPGSFQNTSPGHWTFVGVINGVTLKVAIQLTAPNQYIFGVTAENVSLLGLQTPVTVELNLGNGGCGTTEAGHF